MAESNESSQIEGMVETLGSAGYSVSTDILPQTLIAGLVAEQRRREEGGELTLAGVGRGRSQNRGADLRQVQSSWFDGQSQAEQTFLAFAERMRLAINRRLMLGLFDFEAQFLHYPPGGFYRRHIDALHGERNRVVSLVAYLNEDWANEDGGSLAVWAAPLAGTVVLMLSEQIPHEARVSRRDRRAIAGWFSVNASLGGNHHDGFRASHGGLEVS
jgi:SM-20-related protein